MLKKYRQELIRNNELFFNIKVNTKAKKTELIEVNNNILKINIKAQPEKGKANQELIKYLSKAFHTEQKNVKIIKGAKTRSKLIKIKHINYDKKE